MIWGAAVPDASLQTDRARWPDSADPDPAGGAGRGRAGVAAGTFLEPSDEPGDVSLKQGHLCLDRSGACRWGWCSGVLQACGICLEHSVGMGRRLHSFTSDPLGQRTTHGIIRVWKGPDSGGGSRRGLPFDAGHVPVLALPPTHSQPALGKHGFPVSLGPGEGPPGPLTLKVSCGLPRIPAQLQRPNTDLEPSPPGSNPPPPFPPAAQPGPPQAMSQCPCPRTRAWGPGGRSCGSDPAPSGKVVPSGYPMECPAASRYLTGHQPVQEMFTGSAEGLVHKCSSGNRTNEKEGTPVAHSEGYGCPSPAPACGSRSRPQQALAWEPGLACPPGRLSAGPRSSSSLGKPLDGGSLSAAKATQKGGKLLQEPVPPGTTSRCPREKLLQSFPWRRCSERETASSCPGPAGDPASQYLAPAPPLPAGPGGNHQW